MAAASTGVNSRREDGGTPSCVLIGPLPPGDSEANSRHDIFHPGAF